MAYRKKIIAEAPIEEERKQREEERKQREEEHKRREEELQRREEERQRREDNDEIIAGLAGNY